MKFISAIIASCVFSGVAVGQDMDALDRVQIDAATRKWQTPVTVDVGGYVQTRYTFSSGGGTDKSYGFTVPRARIILSGSVYNWDYKVSGQWSEGGDFNLKDAYASTTFEGVGFKLGQFKTPFMKEVLTSRVDILGIERSIISNNFGQGRSQGVQFSHDFGPVTGKFAYSDGFYSANGKGPDNSYAATGRLDWKATDWLNVGAALSHNEDVERYWTWTADAGVVFGDLTIDAAYVSAEYEAGTEWGTTAQVGYRLSDELQPYAEYQYGELTGEENLSILTAGVNWFVTPGVRFNADFGYSFDGIGSGWETGQTGWSSTTDSGEYLVRAQFQIVF